MGEYDSTFLTTDQIQALYDEVERNRMMVIGSHDMVASVRERLERFGFKVVESQHIPNPAAVYIIDPANPRPTSDWDWMTEGHTDG